MYQSSSFAFINCLPYKWKNEYKFITDFGGTTIQSLTGGHLDNIPEYEKYCWELLYGNNHYKDIAAITHFSKVPDNNLIVEKYKVGRLILKYCKEKGWINVAANTRGRLNCLIVGFQLLTSFIPIFILFFRGINSLRGFFLELSESKYFSWNKIILTDEGERLLAHIYGYKYFLEKCEEEQINKNRELDPNFISDHLPYAIALKLNGQLMK